MSRAESYMSLQQYSKALSDYNTLVALQPKNLYYLIGRGSCKKFNNQLNEAMIDFNKALLLEPKNSDALTERGRLKYTLGDQHGAIEDYNKSIVLNSVKPYGLQL
jgi:tetratricopeptide (TPR) repeat protein